MLYRIRKTDKDNIIIDLKKSRKVYRMVLYPYKRSKDLL